MQRFLILASIISYLFTSLAKRLTPLAILRKKKRSAKMESLRSETLPKENYQTGPIPLSKQSDGPIQCGHINFCGLSKFNDGDNMEHKYNVRNPAVKRLMREASELSEPTDEYYARPLEDNLFEWHFTVHGSPSTDFEGGVYHGRILLPAEYPMKPPNIIMLTPNGRFQTNKKICLSISEHHPETWQPSWSIRTALLAFNAFMSSPGYGTIGTLDYSSEERKLLAKKSLTWECPECGRIANLLSSSKCKPLTKEESEMINWISMKAEEHSKKEPEYEITNDKITSELTDINTMKETNSGTENDVTVPSNRIETEREQEIMPMMSESNSYRGFMWTVLAAIVLLIARRLFLL